MYIIPRTFFASKPGPFQEIGFRGINLLVNIEAMYCNLRYISMFCAPITFLQYLKNTKQGIILPLVILLDGGKTTPLKFYVLTNSVKTLLVHKTFLCILGCITYIFNRGVYASKAILLKKPLKYTCKILVINLCFVHECTVP